MRSSDPVPRPAGATEPGPDDQVGHGRLEGGRDSGDRDGGDRDGPGDLLGEIGVQRRAPFGDSPLVGARGARTQQRILRAALEVFGEVGYRACRVERITEAAGCSRPTFYQYFSSKEDLFRRLAGEVARELFRLDDAMGEITPDAAGWHALRDWLAASAALREQWWPVFAAYSEAEGSDDLVASGAARVGRRQTEALARKVDPAAFEVYEPETVMLLLANAVDRAVYYRQFLERAAPDRAPERDRMLDALAEVLHRSLFGRRGGGLLEPRPGGRSQPPPPPAPDRAADPGGDRLGAAARATRTRLLDAAAGTFAEKGYHDTRVDDVVAAAGTSHGTFYRYFDNKDDAFRAVASRSSRRTFDVIAAIPDLGDDPGGADATRRLRAWVQRYVDSWVDEGPIFRMMVQAFERDPELARRLAAGFEVIRGVLTRFLAHRDVGDLHTDAFLLLALLDLGGPGYGRLDDHHGEVLLRVVRRGFLGIDAPL